MRGFRYAADRLRAVFAAAVLMAFAAFALTACSFGTEEQEEASGSGDVSVLGSGDQTLRIVSGSENKELEPILEEYADEEDIRIEMSYKGSLDIMRLLEEEDISYDAVWPASSLWLTVGDTDHRVKHAESISITPVVFGIRKSLAEELGFVGREVSVRDILSAIEAGKLKFCMTSATQSNSGASAYIGFLYALLGNPEMITMEDLQSEELKTQVRELLYGVDRSSGSSDWLKDMFLEGDFDAMVNYECLMISANQQLEAEGKETLYVVYPYDGLSIADSPFGYVDHGDSGKEEAFLKVQEYLLSDEAQNAIQRTGRRTGYEGVKEENLDVFRSDWGIDTERILSPIVMPSSEVLLKALNLYQTEFKKPSLNVYCLDFSGSMIGEGNRQLVEAMQQILDQDYARQNLLQANQGEVNVVITFSDEINNIYVVNDSTDENLLELYETVASEDCIGGTDIYDAALTGLQMIEEDYDASQYTPAIILMTDGRSNGGMDYSDFAEAYQDYGSDIPVFSIMFGDAREDQLEELANLTNARVFDGREDLIGAFRSVKGYN